MSRRERLEDLRHECAAACDATSEHLYVGDDKFFGNAEVRFVKDGGFALPCFSGCEALWTDVFHSTETSDGALRCGLLRTVEMIEAMLVVGSPQGVLVVSGNGDLIEPDDGIAAIGSGGSYALAAARALLQNTPLGAAEIAERALRIAAEICIYTNDQLTVKVLP